MENICFIFFVIHALFRCRLIQLTPASCTIVSKPWLTIFPTVIPLGDIRVIDIDTIEERHTRKDADGDEEEYYSYTFKVLASRRSTYKPGIIYQGSSENTATFLRLYLGRKLQDLQSGS